MKKAILFVTTTFALLTPTSVFAAGRYSGGYGGGNQGWMIMPEGVYYFNTKQTNTTTTTETRTEGDINLGYHWDLIYLGGEYDYDATSTAVTNQQTSTDSYRSWGARIGIMTENLYLSFSYYISTIGTLAGGTNNPQDLTNGSGYRAELGYLFAVGSGFSLGPAIEYKSLTYTQVNGQAQNFTFTTLVPQVVFKYMFGN